MTGLPQSHLVLAVVEAARPTEGVAMPVLQLLAWSLVLIVIIVAAWKFLGWLRGILGAGGADPVAAVLAAQGAGRWFALLELVNRLEREARPEAVPAAWERIEMPLHAAHADCPPSLAAAVISSLDRLHGLTAERSVQKRIVALRNRFA